MSILHNFFLFLTSAFHTSQICFNCIFKPLGTSGLVRSKDKAMQVCVWYWAHPAQWHEETLSVTEDQRGREVYGCGAVGGREVKCQGSKGGLRA